MTHGKLFEDEKPGKGSAADLQVFQVFTDGACLGNPGPGGWAYILRDAASGEETTGRGGEPRTTNNRMELQAVIEALKSLEKPARILLCADSEYVTKGLSEWMVGWKKRGWRTAAKKPVMNVELWQQLDELNQRHHVEVNWVRGHSGHDENEACDRMASEEARLWAKG